MSDPTSREDFHRLWGYKLPPSSPCTCGEPDPLGTHDATCPLWIPSYPLDVADMIDSPDPPTNPDYAW
jgi:hypothetical protein